MISKALINDNADGATVIDVEVTSAGDWVQIDIVGLTTIMIRRENILSALGDEAHG